MRGTYYPDGTRIYSVWYTRACGLVYHVQVRAADQDQAESMVCRWSPDAYRLIIEPDEFNPELFEKPIRQN